MKLWLSQCKKLFWIWLLVLNQTSSLPEYLPMISKWDLFFSCLNHKPIYKRFSEIWSTNVNHAILNVNLPCESYCGLVNTLNIELPVPVAFSPTSSFSFPLYYSPDCFVCQIRTRIFLSKMLNGKNAGGTNSGTYQGEKAISNWMVRKTRRQPINKQSFTCDRISVRIFMPL